MGRLIPSCLLAREVCPLRGCANRIFMDSFGSQINQEHIMKKAFILALALYAVYLAAGAASAVTTVNNINAAQAAAIEAATK